MNRPYVFEPGERVAWEYPIDQFGVVVKLGPQLGLFGNYGVLVKWDHEKEPSWHDDLDLAPAPVVALLASIPTDGPSAATTVFRSGVLG